MTLEHNKITESYFPKVISDLIGFAIFMIDQYGIIISWNIGCEKMKGYKAEEVIGKHFELLFPNFLKDLKLHQEELDKAKIVGRYETENWRKKKDGSLFWAKIVLTKVINEEGEFIGYAKITQDESMKKNFENEIQNKNQDLQKIKEQLEKAQEIIISSNKDILIKKNANLVKINQDLDGFIYTASHDLRHPIANMEGLMDAISETSFYNDEQLNQLLSMMEQSIEKLKKTIDELTEISKIQNSIDEDFQDIDLKDLIEEVSLSLKHLSNNRKVNVEIDIARCPIIKFQLKNLRSIFYNLLSNAIAYSAFNRKCEILIETFIEDGNYIIIIKDNGLGIKKENQEMIFSMFKRFHDHVEGSGIGLYMVKRIVDNAGGKIKVESEIGKGSSFTVSLNTELMHEKILISQRQEKYSTI